MREALAALSNDGNDAGGGGGVEGMRRGPVVINETNDNCGAGCPGDGTHLLRAMLDAGLGTARGPRKVAFGFFCDAEAVRVAVQAGIGAMI